jgi:hypothetical protein
MEIELDSRAIIAQIKKLGNYRNLNEIAEDMGVNLSTLLNWNSRRAKTKKILEPLIQFRDNIPKDHQTSGKATLKEDQQKPKGLDPEILEAFKPLENGPPVTLERSLLNKLQAAMIDSTGRLDEARQANRNLFDTIKEVIARATTVIETNDLTLKKSQVTIDELAEKAATKTSTESLRSGNIKRVGGSGEK